MFIFSDHFTFNVIGHEASLEDSLFCSRYHFKDLELALMSASQLGQIGIKSGLAFQSNSTKKLFWAAVFEAWIFPAYLFRLFAVFFKAH